MAPRLTPSGRALLPAMAAKARIIIENACSPRGDEHAFMADLAGADPTCESWEDFAAKIIGIAISPRMDGQDVAFYEVMAALEDSGIFSPEEMAVLERNTPLLRSNWGFHYPKEIRAYAFADFVNGRNEEGTLGENLPHIAIRRAWERLLEMFAGLKNLGNRSGFMHAGDLFVPAYVGRSVRELSPTGPGEVIYPGLNDNKVDFEW